MKCHVKGFLRRSWAPSYVVCDGKAGHRPDAGETLYMDGVGAHYMHTREDCGDSVRFNEDDLVPAEQEDVWLVQRRRDLAAFRALPLDLTKESLEEVVLRLLGKPTPWFAEDAEDYGEGNVLDGSGLEHGVGCGERFTGGIGPYGGGWGLGRGYGIGHGAGDGPDRPGNVAGTYCGQELP